MVILPYSRLESPEAGYNNDATVKKLNGGTLL